MSLAFAKLAFRGGRMADRPLSFWIKAAKQILPLVAEFQALSEADRKNWRKLIPLAQKAIAVLASLGLTFEDLGDIAGNSDVLDLVEALAGRR